MSIEAMATRMSVLTRALPRRILLVDDDDLELALLSNRLGAAGFDVAIATNGEQALSMLAQQWYPLVITDWQMPLLDGIAFTAALRARGVNDTYVIMLTMRESSLDYERGYRAGVDDYLTKNLSDVDLFARIHAAFNTLTLRRSLQEAHAELERAGTAHSGIFTPRELLNKLHSEVRRARRYGRMLSVLTIGVRVAGSDAIPAAALVREVADTLQRTVRTDVDWLGRLDTPTGHPVFAIVLPEAAPTDGPMIKERVLGALGKLGREGQALEFQYGLAGLERASSESTAVEAGDLLGVAEQCRMCCGHAGPAQLSAVQRSVAAGVTIACRYGYALDTHCTLMTELAPPPRSVEPSSKR